MSAVKSPVAIPLRLIPSPSPDDALRAKRGSHFVGLFAFGLAVLLSGCHKSKTSYRPPAPPPLTSSSANNRAGEATPPSRNHRTPPEDRRSNSPDPETPSSLSGETRGKPASTEVGLASWYGPPYHNHKAADGSIFDQNALTVAHRTLPLGTTVRVTNLETNQSVVAKVTDRGPFVAGRTLDLSLAAAKAIGVYRAGVARVKVEAFPYATPDIAGRWCVQVGVFIDPADAIQLKNDLARRYTTAKVIEFAGPTGHWVRINPAQADRPTAARIADSIHLPDAEPFLVRTD